MFKERENIDDLTAQHQYLSGISVTFLISLKNKRKRKTSLALHQLIHFFLIH